MCELIKIGGELIKVGVEARLTRLEKILIY